MLLLRVSTSEAGTFGVLVHDDVPFALTLERPWTNNMTDLSCIPEGIYTCKRVHSPKFGETFEVMDVPNRTNVLLHKGNTLDDTHGCILVGEQFTMQDGRPMLAASAVGYAVFMEKVKTFDVFPLTIKDVTHG